MKIILASSSLNRKALFDRMGFKYEIKKPDYDETPLKNETTTQQVMRHAHGKAQNIAKNNFFKEETLIIGFDSMISTNKGESIGKATSENDMIRMISSFSGTTQHVITGVSLVYIKNKQTQVKTFSESTKVTFKNGITPEICQKYATFNDWAGKCGAWSVLGSGQWFLESIEGDFQNIVGVPVITMGKIAEKLTGKNIWDIFEKK